MDPLCAGAVYLSESYAANSSDRLNTPRPRGRETTGVLSNEHVVEIFTSQFGSMDQFDWFTGYNDGFCERWT